MLDNNRETIEARLVVLELLMVAALAEIYRSRRPDGERALAAVRSDIAKRNIVAMTLPGVEAAIADMRVQNAAEKIVLFRHLEEYVQALVPRWAANDGCRPR